MSRLSSHLKLPCMENTILSYSSRFQGKLQVCETVIYTGHFSRAYNNTRTSRYMNKYKPGWRCWFCFHNEKASMTNLLKFRWRHQYTCGQELSDAKFQFTCPCTVNSTQWKKREKKKKKVKKKGKNSWFYTASN